MKKRSSVLSAVAKYGYIAAAVFFIAAGILFILLPEVTLVVLCRVIGIIMMVFGAVRLVGYYSKDLYRLAFQYDLEFGIVMAVLGLLVVIYPEKAVNVLCLAYGIITLADALFRIRIAFEAKRFGIRVWWIVFVAAILTGIVAAVLMFRPGESAKVITVLLGISLVAEGILSALVAFSSVKVLDEREDPYIIDQKEE
ncbi:MAG: DUF308 domain-containing protein [Lachnospiraceae bacterium]|nr:DUF308 domain-containing protein [Lachnospiraceae bacterium]